MKVFTGKTHNLIHFVSLLLAFASLPFSNFSLSVALIALTVNWLLAGNWSARFLRIKTDRELLLFLLLYLSLIVGLLYTSNYVYALKDLKLKLPLLLIPVVVTTSEPLKPKEYLTVLAVFCLAVLAASGYSTYLFATNYFMGGSNVRNISPFISHIRLSLMVGMAAFTLFWFSVKNSLGTGISGRVLLLILALWLVFFLLILQSLTGIVAFVLTAILLLVVSIFKIKNDGYRLASIVFVTFFMLFVLSYLTHSVDRFFTRNFVDFSQLSSHTQKGNPYYHDPNAREYENGNLIWVNVCWSEMEKEWNKVASLPFSGNDKMGQPLSFTALRYLTSLGYTKDSAGISKLDKADILLIEAGATSVVFKNKRFGIYPRLYQLLWEIDQYKNFGKISGSPFIQRLVYLRTAFRIIADNFFLGVGTGDLIDEFYAYYQKFEPQLERKYWYPSHNMFVTQFVTLGLWGFIVFLVAWFIPFFLRKAHSTFISLAFFSIVTLSMLNEDTLLTHIGISFTALFYSFLVLAKPICNGNEN